MASICREVVLDASPDAVWDAVRDWGALDERLARGFVTDCREDGADRIVTFFNGSVLRERIISCDDASRRLAWSIVDGPYVHHNGAAQVFAEDGDRTRFAWTADLLPDELADRTEALMDIGLIAIRETLNPKPLRTAAPVGAD